MQLLRIQRLCSAKQAKLVQSQLFIIKKLCGRKMKADYWLAENANLQRFFYFKNVGKIKKNVKA